MGTQQILLWSVRCVCMRRMPHRRSEIHALICVCVCVRRMPQSGPTWRQEVSRPPRWSSRLLKSSPGTAEIEDLDPKDPSHAGLR